MNKLPIAAIKAELKNMYAAFRFDMKAVPSTNCYTVTVFRNRLNLSTIAIPADTPLNEFWDRIKAWMRPFLKYHGSE